MNRYLKIGLLVTLGCFLIIIRLYEDAFFYDPLISFFKLDYTKQKLPEIDTFKLLWNVFFRFLLNTGLSLLVIWIVFKEITILKFASLLYLILFILLFIMFCYLVFYASSTNYLPLFYVRRFLIQPIFLLILLPAFYFQKK